MKPPSQPPHHELIGFQLRDTAYHRACIGIE